MFLLVCAHRKSAWVPNQQGAWQIGACVRPERSITRGGCRANQIQAGQEHFIRYAHVEYAPRAAARSAERTPPTRSAVQRSGRSAEAAARRPRLSKRNRAHANLSRQPALIVRCWRRRPYRPAHRACRSNSPDLRFSFSTGPQFPR